MEVPSEEAEEPVREIGGEAEDVREAVGGGHGEAPGGVDGVICVDGGEGRVTVGCEAGGRKVRAEREEEGEKEDGDGDEEQAQHREELRAEARAAVCERC